MNENDKRRLDALATWMREHGAEHVVLTADRLEVRLGPAPVAASPHVADETYEEMVKRQKAEEDRYLFAATEGYK